MSNRYITMNGVQFNPSSIDIEESKFGTSRRMGDGTLRYYHRANKYKWTLDWTNVRETLLPAIRTVGRLTTSFTFIDYENTSYTVIILPGGFTLKLSANGVDSAGLKRYNVTLVLDQV